MPNISEVYSLLKPAQNSAVKTVENQSTNDIILQVLKQHQSNAIEAKKIAHLFDGGNLYSTCEIIWNFLKYQVPYAVEPSEKQSTKTLSRILYDAMHNKGNDCKHYSSFTGAILSALGYDKDFVYRFAGYSKYHKIPTHVYVVAKDGDGKIYCDAVINGFDLEKPYQIKFDKKPNMSLYSLSGVDETLILEPQVGGVFSKIKTVAKKVATPIKKAATAVKQAALTTGLAIPRNAFLLLVKFNVHGWATGMQKLSWDELVFWKNIGGNRTDLENAIKAGSKNKRLLGLSDDDVLIPSMVDTIGVEPVTVTAALTTAAPIIVKIESLLDKSEKISNAIEKVKSTASSTKGAVDKAKQGFKALTGKDVTDIIYKKESGKTGGKAELTVTDFSTPTDADANRIAKALVTNKPMNKNIILLGGAALAAFLILKKK